MILERLPAVATHLFKSDSITPGPNHFPGKVGRIAWCKVESVYAILNQFSHSAKPRTNHRNSASERFNDHHPKSFVPKTWHHQETRTL
jgi:hypothetical protein